ncbi:MAG: cation acetate symporter, partial [Lentisphaeria bacterium]|nr:cation acetate symporter [Lentisphaeria bacterium]
EGAIAGMLVGILSTAAYVIYFKFLGGDPKDYICGIHPNSFGAIGMCLNFITAVIVCSFTKPPPQEIQDLVEHIRIPKGAGDASDH